MGEPRSAGPGYAVPFLASLVIAAVIGGTAGAAPAAVAGDMRIAVASQFDGSYGGYRTTTRGGPPICRHGTQREVVTVSNGQFSYTYNGIVSVVATIAADGSFDGTAQYMYGRTQGIAVLRGHIVNNVLEADLSGQACTYHLSLTKAGSL
jgi:hypothetical protein